MQYSVASVLALAATASAYAYSNETISYTTETHTALTTVCPSATELTYNGVTYTATAVRHLLDAIGIQGMQRDEKDFLSFTSRRIHLRFNLQSEFHANIISRAPP